MYSNPFQKSDHSFTVSICFANGLTLLTVSLILLVQYYSMFKNSTNATIYIIHPDHYAHLADIQAALLLIENIAGQDRPAAQYLTARLLAALSDPVIE